MKKLIFCLAVILAGVMSNSCRQAASRSNLPFNPYVEAFTSGEISRQGTVCVVFQGDVDSTLVAATNWRKAASISPRVEGEFVFENSHTLVFKPAESFARKKEYAVTLQISEWFAEARGADKSFTFTFSTLPLTVRGSVVSLKPVGDVDKPAYDVTALIHTSDSESPETVEGLVKFQQQGDVEWSHAPDGKKHEVVMKNLAARNQSHSYTVSIASNKLGVEGGDLFSFEIPGSQEFTVFDSRFESSPQHYIEITFSKNLDKKQDLVGLARIEGNNNERVTVDGNKLRLYPDPQLKGRIIVHLSESIRSQGGVELGEAQQIAMETAPDVPSIRFIGRGTLLPQSEKLIVPFQTTWLRGVIVRVIKVQERNVGQFLQINALDGSKDMVRVGRLVARRTIFFDEAVETDPGRINICGLALDELISPEPGAIYRIELDADKTLSTYPTDDTAPKPTRAEILAQDAVRFRDESKSYDPNGHYYYYYDSDDDDWDSNTYYTTNYTPDQEYFWYGMKDSRNVLATNLGLMVSGARTGEFTVVVHNLTTTRPERGVEVSVRNFQHMELGRGTTDERGRVTIDCASGKAFYVVASLDRQRSYLRVDDPSALSLSSFDVSGEVVQKGIKGFIYGDRGVWRPGDTLHIGFMVGDRAQSLPADHPVTLELIDPLGQTYVKKTSTSGVMGTRVFDLPTGPDVPTGAWTVRIEVGGVTFTKGVRIETIKPNRLKIEIGGENSTLLKGEAMELPIHIEWMTGAKARNLGFDIQGTFYAASTAFPKFKDYTFEDPAKSFGSEESDLVKGSTDPEGNGTIDARLNVGDAAAGMLTGNFVVHAYEPSGESSVDAFRMNYSPYKHYVGIRSPKRDNNRDWLTTGSPHRYDIVTVDHNGLPAAGRDLDVTIYRVRWYWWYSSNTERLASFIADSDNKPVKRYNIKSDGEGKANISLNFTRDEWGTYYISVKDRSGRHSTGVMDYYDWPELTGRRDAEGGKAANVLSFKTDKSTYAPGEKINVTIPSSAGARAVVQVMNGSRVLSIEEFECSGSQTTFNVAATEEMMPNAYLYVTLLQPHGNTVNDRPIRLYGVVGVTVSSPGSHLSPVITVADEIKPQQGYEIVVSEQNKRAMSYTLAVVDEGLLDLTRFRTPDPWSTFNAREALGVSMWDLYNHVIGAYGGRIEQVFSIGGDDEAGGGKKAIVNRFPPVVQFEGPFLLKAGQSRKHSYVMPNYNGRVRVMVVAGDGKAYGNAEKSVFVRKPVMILGTLPRVIGLGEEMDVPATVFATKENVGKVVVTIQTSDNMEVVGDRKKTLNFSRVGDRVESFRVRVKGTPGVGKVTITASGGGDQAVSETEIEIRSVRRPQIKVTEITLEGGKSWNNKVTLPGAKGSNKVSLEMSDVPPLNLTSRLEYLLGYPHGCLEQITSKGFPQLYLKGFASLTKAQEASIETAVKAVLDRYRTYRMNDGSLSYWPGGSYSNGWASAYATHFMLEAEAKGYHIPAGLKGDAVGSLARQARAWKKGGESNYYASDTYTQAYRLFVLAQASSAELGAMNRLRERKDLDRNTRWMLASAYALSGRADVAGQLTSQTTGIEQTDRSYDLTYGSDLRDVAARLITMSLLDRSSDAATLAREISKSLSGEAWHSTQTTAFALVAMSKYMARYKTGSQMSFSYNVGGTSGKVSTDKNFWMERVLENGGTTASIEITNKGASTLFGRVVTEGIPEQGAEEAYAKGVTIEVAYKGVGSDAPDLASMEQGINFKAVVTVRNPTGSSFRNLAITQVLPAGWEILNTRYLNDGATDQNTPGISYQDIRDDRVLSYIDYLPGGRQVTFSIDLSSTYRGKFYLPPIYCEAMYDYAVRANSAGEWVEIK